MAELDGERLTVGAATEIGRVREENEDTIYVAEADAEMVASNGLLLAVADGAGGYQRGEVASQLAIETLRSEFYASEVGPTEIPNRLKQAFRRANERIYADGAASGDENLMATTLVGAVIRGTSLTIANVGDSRAYLVRANRLTQVTRDHSLVAEQVAAGAMTREEARESQHRHIVTRVLGHRQRVDVDIYEVTLLPDDRLILSTDGVHDWVDEDEMTSIALNGYPEEAARALVQAALEHESNDNVSAIVAWMAPAGVALEPLEAEPVGAGSGSMLMMVLALVVLLVFVAIVILLLYIGA